jgi:hypothetical protein
MENKIVVTEEAINSILKQLTIITEETMFI